MSSFFEKEIHTGIVKLILFSKMLFKSKNSKKETKESFHVSFIVYVLNAIISIIERFKNKRTNFLLTFLFYFAMHCAIWYHLYNFKKSEKHSWRSVTFSKVAGFSNKSSTSRTLSNTPPWVFFTIF